MKYKLNPVEAWQFSPWKMDTETPWYVPCWINPKIGLNNECGLFNAVEEFKRTGEKINVFHIMISNPPRWATVFPGDWIVRVGLTDVEVYNDEEFRFKFSGSYE